MNLMRIIQIKSWPISVPFQICVEMSDDRVFSLPFNVAEWKVSAAQGFAAKFLVGISKSFLNRLFYLREL